MYKDFPAEYYALLTGKKNAVLLETSRYDTENQQTLLFLNPLHILQIDRVSDLDVLLQAIQYQTQQGYYVAGYFGYECGSHFENIRPWETAAQDCPLAWFGVYNKPLIFNHATGQLDLASCEVGSLYPSCPMTTSVTDTDTYTVGDIQFDLTWSQYREKVAQVKQYIQAGDTYQINFTGRYHFPFEGSPLAFYKALKKKQQVLYGAYIRTARQDILCFSPELFFRVAEDRITTKPMKGTAPRGRTEAEDQQRVAWLQSDEKNRAENVMIVDLLRNDLGRLCRIGSIHVPQMFMVEKYATLFQMTSTVEGILSDEQDYTALIRSLFPCGSVTGAPKIRSMQIIRELESSPRGVYTGAIGYFAPQAAPRSGSAQAVVSRATTATALFNVAIRTIVLHKGQGTMGIGSGIVSDSVAEDEYAECAVKAAFLTTPFVEFALLETLLWDNGYRQLEKHLFRLAHSAAYFAYSYDHEQMIRVLMQYSTGLAVGQKYKVRLVVERTGAITCESFLIEQEPVQKMATIVVSRTRTHTSNPFLYHKTTNRVFYDEAYRQAVQEGHADSIFLNERGEVTEGAISNIFIEKNNRLLTPALHCGLLNGVYRQCILEKFPDVNEAILSFKDLQEADSIYICNAIKGWRQVTLVSPKRSEWGS